MSKVKTWALITVALLTGVLFTAIKLSWVIQMKFWIPMIIIGGLGFMRSLDNFIYEFAKERKIINYKKAVKKRNKAA
ncbi:MAG: hypothetical protein PHC62_00235 [Candidatus Izemoplasmatales bacterium]|nr:hypothetical protein [Candidatus Izemoplasmatales bacterium]